MEAPLTERLERAFSGKQVLSRPSRSLRDADLLDLLSTQRAAEGIAKRLRVEHVAVGITGQRNEWPQEFSLSS